MSLHEFFFLSKYGIGFLSTAIVGPIHGVRLGASETPGPALLIFKYVMDHLPHLAQQSGSEQGTQI